MTSSSAVFSGAADKDYSLATKTYGATVGMVLDTAVAYDSLFNLRFQIDYSLLSNSIKSEMLEERYLFYFIKPHSVFGFSPIRKRCLRFWFGPGLGLSYMQNQQQSKESLTAFNIDFNIGLNFHFASELSAFITVAGGYTFNTAENIIDNSRQQKLFQKADGHGYNFAIYYGFLYRLRDKYLPGVY